ncbi:U3 small nucleolar RNA-associated protein 25 homolog isoform X2 [Halichondria panicea]|uniref:U3 small nucleolar RNA-associated protein 25 homolog isoform X2 n=1 Tax=Halichondria panicea TaxID=6063 RepID=UPI00312B87FE
MGRGGRHSGRRKGGRKVVKKRRHVTPAPLPQAPNKRPPPHATRTLSSDEEDDPTDYDLLLGVLGPMAKRPKTEDAKKTRKELSTSLSNRRESVESDASDGVDSDGVGGASDGVESDADDPGDDSEACDDVESVEGDGCDDVESDGCEGAETTNIDPFKVHFEQLLTDQQVEQLAQNHPPSYTQSDDTLLGAVEVANPLPERASVIGVPGNEQLFLKQQLKQHHSLVTSPRLQQSMFNILNSYKDLLFMRRTFENGEEIRRTYLLHALNHVLKTRSRVLKNKARLVQAAKTNKVIDDVGDQGLTRPKVLILLPFRECALRTINTLVELLLPQGEGVVSHKKRFQEEFSEEAHLPSKIKKPKSYEEMFAGNIDDCFRVGVSIKRNLVRLYSEFYSSDIILASPLGLRTILGADGEKTRDYDFLSSIELLIVDQCDVFLMQNWDHLLHIFAHLHLTPREAHGADISRLREWAVNEWGKYYRQTLVFSSFFTPEINALFNNYCHNYAGRVRVGEGPGDGCVSQVVVQAPQVFHRVHCLSHKELPEARLTYFVEKILPDFCGELTKQTAIFVPSYFDFVRVRNHMKRAELSHCLLSEYTKTSQVSRCRTEFYHKQKHFLLYTERLHFFRRYHLRGIHHLIFYSLPLYAEFYPELVNMLEEAGQMGGVTCTVLYSRYELHMLSRIVGNVRARKMLESNDNVHMIVMGT